MVFEMECFLATELDGWPSAWKEGEPEVSHLVSLDLGPHHLVVGRSNGQAEVYTRGSEDAVNLLWAKYLGGGPVDQICLAGDAKQQVAIACDDKTSLLDLQSGEVIRTCSLGQQVTCLFWSASSLYIGGSGGRVAVLSLDEDSPLRQVLQLDSQVVQITAEADLMVVSTFTRAVVCNLCLKTFQEVGSKARQGEQGVALAAGRLWAARPGCRLWEVDKETAAVVSTRQFRAVLSELPASRLHGLAGQRLSHGGSHGFTKLRACGNVLLSWSPTGRLYLLDAENSGLLAWTSFTPSTIKDAVLDGDTVAVLDTKGHLRSITFGSLSHLIAKARDLNKAGPWSDLLLLNRGNIRALLSDDLNVVWSSRQLLGQLEDKDRAARVSRLLDSVQALLYRGQNFAGQRVAPRSFSQERGSEEACEKWLNGAKSQSEENLLDGGQPLSFGRRTRGLSASEQGLQALQLYNIKCKKMAGSLQGSPAGSRATSREHLSSRVHMHSSRDSLDPSPSGSCEFLEQDQEQLGQTLLARAAEAGLQIDKDLFSTKVSQADSREQVQLADPYAGLFTQDGTTPGEETVPPSAAEEKDERFAAEILGDSITEDPAKLGPPESLDGNSRASKELTAARKSKEIEELSKVASDLSQPSEDSLDLTSRMSSLFVRLLKSDLKEDTSDELDLVLQRIQLSSHLDEKQHQDFEKAVNVIFSTNLHRELFFRPMTNLGCGDTTLPNSVIHPNLMMLFNENELEMDQLTSNSLMVIRDLICCDSLLASLNVTDFYTFKYLLDLDESNRPELSPIRLQQIDEGNVNDCANFLSNHEDIAGFTLLRYLIHLAMLDTECALLVAQAHTLSMPPQCLFFFVLSHQESLAEVASLNGLVSCNLGEAVHQSVATLLVRVLASHLPGWTSAWQETFNQYPNLHGFVLDAFKTSNETRLGRKTNLIGAHRSPEGLEVAPLGNFLLKLAGADSDETQVEWCRSSLFLPGMVRALLSSPHLAAAHLPLLVELGDVKLLDELNLLEGENAKTLVEHLVNTYKSEESPIAWESLASPLLSRNKCSQCMELLLLAAPKLKPGTLPRRFYAELIVRSIQEQSISN